jgi:hypothetical protein
MARAGSSYCRRHEFQSDIKPKVLGLEQQNPCTELKITINAISEELRIVQGRVSSYELLDLWHPPSARTNRVDGTR